MVLISVVAAGVDLEAMQCYQRFFLHNSSLQVKLWCEKGIVILVGVVRVELLDIDVISCAVVWCCCCLGFC